jgi:hypothetical protein
MGRERLAPRSGNMLMQAQSSGPYFVILTTLIKSANIVIGVVKFTAVR